jgi:spore maturation protein CgeB
MRSFKETLRRFAVLRGANAMVKASTLRLRRAALNAAYERRARAMGIGDDQSAVPSRLAERLRRRGIDPRELPDRLGVLWVGADFHQDRGGFVQSLERLSDLTCFHRENGDYGLQAASADGQVRRNDPAVIAMNDARLLYLVKEQIASGRPLHAVMGQLWANVISADALREVQRLGVITVNVSMDDRLPEHWRIDHGYRLGSVGLVPGVDLVLTTSPECCLWYAVEGGLAQWWPLASDPEVFVPAPEEEKIHDVSFVGRRYGVRDSVVSALEHAGVRVSSYGPGWPNGPIGAEHVATVFAQSRIILGVGTIAHNTNVYTLKLRDFDAPMSGSLYITHRNPDLQPLFREGEEIECYEDASELVTKVRHYLAHPGQRMAVAAGGRARALHDHTWDARLSDLFTTLRGGNA